MKFTQLYERMTKLRKKLFSLFLVLIVFLIACSSGETNNTEMSKAVAHFDFTTQDNESLSLDDLKGDWWIADFIFTNCTTACLPMSSNMSLLQEKIKEANMDNVKLISFSVDPDYDTPEVLTEYAERYDADLNIWTFLTGYDFQTIKELSIKSFANLVKEPDSGSDQVMHGTRFFLVNPDGVIIKNYEGMKADEMDVIFNDLQKLVK